LMYLGGSRNFGPQMKYADRRSSPCVVIQGSDERARGIVQVKDLILGAELSGEIESREEWREARPAQVEVAEEDLVKTVAAVLERHAPGRD
jgi:histidyl-tRNA synthetase